MSDAISNANPEKVDRRVLAAALKAADGNLKKVSVPRAAITPRSIDEWARIITGDLTRAVEGIIAAGRHLQEAKAEVDHGDWLPLLERLKIGERTAQMLMKVAANEALADPNHWFGLPTSWRTLSELATVPPDILEARITDGTITPTFTREDAVALKKQTERAARKQLRDAPADVFDWREHWQGMPSFSMSGDTPPCKKINVLFASWEDVKVFSKLINQTVTPKTKSVWFPPVPKRSRKDLMYHNKDPDPPLDDVEDVRGGDRAVDKA